MSFQGDGITGPLITIGVCRACGSSVHPGRVAEHIEHHCPAHVRCTTFKRKEKSLLITGGTGSFGQAFVQEAIRGDWYGRIVVYSRDEQKQQAMKARFNDVRLRFFLGDVRDRTRLIRALQGIDTVIHAAALKMVDRSADAFDEFFKTNCLGSLNVVEACHRAGVEKCIALSTDKACASSTPYGSTKEVMSWMFISGNAWGNSRFSVIRYGNILDSRGGALSTLSKLYEGGKRLPVTDSRMTRFWLTIEDAVNYVREAIGLMRGGETFVPKGLDRNNILETFRKWFPDAQFDVVGKRAYEKRHEVLIAAEEADRTRDCDGFYVILPHEWRWQPAPYGAEFPPVREGFEYRSDAWEKERNEQHI